MPDESPVSPNESRIVSGKDIALERLRQYRGWAESRDPLVCAAKRAGATYTEIVTSSGLAKGTVNTILARAGLTGPQTSNLENAMPTSTAARYYPHHSHFISATPRFGRVEYEFKPFTGDEPKPEPPRPMPPYVAPEKRTAEQQAMADEFTERVAEYDVMKGAWREAVYRKQMTPLINAAYEARPAADAALREMDDAWAALDNAEVWPVAVKRVLDAHDAARTAMEQWMNQYAKPLATAESQFLQVSERLADWRGLAYGLGHDGRLDVGWTYDGHYDASPMDEVNDKIAKQRQRLEEIAKFGKQEDKQDD